MLDFCNTCLHKPEHDKNRSGHPCSTCYVDLHALNYGKSIRPTKYEERDLGEKLMKESPFPSSNENTLFSSITETFYTDISEKRNTIIEEIVENVTNDIANAEIKHTICFDRDRIITAVRNAIPVKPVVAESCWQCGSCRSDVHWTQNYCGHCGQKIDWVGEAEK